MNIFAVEYDYGSQTAGVRDDNRPAHRSWLQERADEGRVLSAGAFADGAGALLVIRAESEEAVSAMLQQDPFFQAGAIDGMKITAWKPVIGAFADGA